jgi:hypothetical protein
VNTWIELVRETFRRKLAGVVLSKYFIKSRSEFQPGDDSTRVEEAVLRSIVSSVANLTNPETTKRILNPNEVLAFFDD